MIKKILRFVFNLYRDDFLDFAVEDLYKNIPRHISDQGIELIVEKKKQVEHWFLYQAFFLQRRIPKSKKGVDITFGMLLQIKLMLHMIGKHEVRGDEITMTEYKKQKDAEKAKNDELDKHIKDVNSFVTHEKKKDEG